MGTNVKVIFPVGILMQNVADVAAILLGCEKYWEESRGTKWVEVQDVSRASSSIPEMAYINIKLINTNNPAARLIRKSDGDVYAMTYHFEGDGSGGPEICPKSTAAKIALCKALVNFFGGRIDYNDCDSTDTNFKRPARNPISAHDGNEWDKFQQAIDKVKPLTQKDIDAVSKWAAY